jgi:outer membrane lipoprotein SlyB
MRTRISLLLIVVFFVGCATPQQRFQKLSQDYNTRIDPASIMDQSQYQDDYDYCVGIAAQLEQKAIQDAQSRFVMGSLLGALVGGAIGGVVDSDYMGEGAAIGAISGGVSGAGSTPVHSSDAFGRCMLNRGYKLFW